jgi:C_GCAxxG_C_C family probable redox protein
MEENVDREHETVGRRGRALYLEMGFCCSESVLLAIAESKDIRSEWLPGIATGFCGGVSHTSGMCGAVSGAIMAIGLLTGRHKPEDSREETFDMVQELVREFQDRFGSANCGELLGCDLGTPEGREHVKVHNLRGQCADYVEAATGTVARLLKDK